MSAEGQLVFPPFSFDKANDCLLRDRNKIPLRPRSLAVLRYLLEHPHRLVPKQELLDAVWKNTRVSDAAAKVTIREIRRALGDDVETSKFIESVGRQGYRFIGSIVAHVMSNYGQVPVVGRQEELEQLRSYLDRANGGRRQVLFITGEAGIGKTALVEAFLATLPHNGQVLTAYGQCIEQFGAGEAYMPILDALEEMGGPSNKNDVIKSLRHYAPSWLLNLPTLISPEERAELERQSIGITLERRLREIAAFLEAIAQAQTIVLVLANLHWADPSTLALISFLARRRESARLLLIGTYRDTDIERQNRPLKAVEAELHLHNYCAHSKLSMPGRRNW
jgi:DNA-binding winged helix-turn-helix (wHTH) protein